MPGRPIQHYVTQHILEHGGFEALIERIRQGETVAMIARTLFKPDGQAIHRTTLSHMLHARADRSAQVGAAKANWRRRPRAERLAIRKRLRATASLRAMRALLGMREPPAPSILPAEPRRPTFPTTPEGPRASPPHAPARAAATTAPPPASRPLVGTPPVPALVIPPPVPEPLRQPRGVEWRYANGGYAWCHDCETDRCSHAKLEYMRQVNAYAAQQFPPRRIAWLH